MQKCPGQDTRYWTPRDVFEVRCPACEATVEFWKDEDHRKCPRCGGRASNPNFDMGCLEWCRYASECRGRMLDARQETAGPVREGLRKALGEIFDRDPRRIEHAERVLELAEEIGRMERADPLIVVPAALLHDVGLAGCAEDAGPDVEGRHGARGAEEAAKSLKDQDLPDSVVGAVTDIIAHHHERDALSTVNRRVIWDADLIANLQGQPRDEAVERLDREALTESGRSVGRRRLGG